MCATSTFRGATRESFLMRHTVSPFYTPSHAEGHNCVARWLFPIIMQHRVAHHTACSLNHMFFSPFCPTKKGKVNSPAFST